MVHHSNCDWSLCIYYNSLPFSTAASPSRSVQQKQLLIRIYQLQVHIMTYGPAEKNPHRQLVIGDVITRAAPNDY